MNVVSKFLSCDWGTTSFRLRLVDTANFSILSEQKANDGNATTFENWNKAGRPNEERLIFYLAIIRKHLKAMEVEGGQSFDGLPLVISGMASSTIGMAVLPYKELPFQIDGSDLQTKTFKASPDFPNEVVLISGVKSHDDVMRGEETQLIGFMAGQMSEKQLFIHPGTHSKHISIVNGKAVAFKSYMTGELFSLLSNQSILSASVKGTEDFLHHPEYLKSFREGVSEGIERNLLHQLFMVRTNDLFDRLSQEQNYYYLSGLLIGSELKDFPKVFTGDLLLAGEDTLTGLYLEALKTLGIDRQVHALVVKNADEVTLKGQYQVYINLKQ